MAILASNLKLSIYDAITRNQITEINIQDYVSIPNSIKQSAYYKCGDVIMRFLKNTNYLGVYLKNQGDFLIIRISEPENTKPVYRLQLQDKLSFIEMDPFSKNFFIFGQKSIEYGNIKTQKMVCIEEGQSIEVQIVNSNENLEEDFQSDQTESEDGDTKFPKSVSSQIPSKMNVEDCVKEDDNQLEGDLEQGRKKNNLGVTNSKNQSGMEQEMDEESDEEDDQQQEIEEIDNQDDEKSEEVEEDEDMDEEQNLSGIIPEEEDGVEGNNKISKKGNNSNTNSRNNLCYKKSSNTKKSQHFKQKANDRNNIGIQSGTNISINNSTHNNNNNDGINGEAEMKLLDSNSYATFLKQRCTKRKKVILGFVNRQIVIYEIMLSDDNKEISFQLINRLELNELHEYDMSFVQMSSNVQNDKFALVLDKKFMHLFSLNQHYQIGTYSEEYLSQDQTKRYMNPIFWRDPFDKEKPEYFVYLDNTHLNCSICFMNLKTSKRQIVILQADKPRNFVQNMRWEGCLGVIGEGGSIFILEYPRCYYWENFSYRFKGLEKNQQYIEKEDEFDYKYDDTEKKPLTADEFDNLKTHYADFLYPEQNKIFIDGTFDYRDKDE